jgi:hypothetical protein
MALGQEEELTPYDGSWLLSWPLCSLSSRPSLLPLSSLLSPPSSPLPSVVVVVDHRHDCVRHATVVSAARSMAEGTSVEPAGGAEKAPHGKARGMGA